MIMNFNNFAWLTRNFEIMLDFNRDRGFIIHSYVNLTRDVLDLTMSFRLSFKVCKGNIISRCSEFKNLRVETHQNYGIR